jgi:hypothetical protein
MQVWLPEQKRLDDTRFFLWMRIVVGSMAAVIGGWQALTDFHDGSRWIGSLSVACFLLFWRIRQPGESRRVYLTNPRMILTNLSALSMTISAAWSLIRHA